MQSDHRYLTVHIKEFLNRLRTDKEFIPFLELQKVQQMGVSDFHLASQSFLTLSVIERRAGREKRYTNVSSFVEDMCNMLQGVQDYIFENHPLQLTCESFKKVVRQFGENLDRKMVQWGKSRSKQRRDEREKSKEVPEEEQGYRNQKLEILEQLFGQPYFCSLVALSHMYDLGSITGSQYNIRISDAARKRGRVIDRWGSNV